MGSVLIVLFYILLVVGALCGIINMVILFSMSTLITRLSERLGELVEMLYVVGQQQQTRMSRQRQDASHLTGMGDGLQNVESAGTYDERYTRPLLPPQDLKNTPISPTGHPDNQSWETSK